MTDLAPPADGSVEPSVFGAEPPCGEFYFLRDLVHARRQGGRPASGVMRDYLSICLRKRRVLSPDHYFKFRLYELDEGERHTIHDYVDDVERRELNLAINRHGSGSQTIENKLYLESVLRDRGIASAETLAVLLGRQTSSGVVVTSEEALRGRLVDAPCPLFGKPVVGSLSSGAIVIERYDRGSDRLHLAGDSEIPLGSFLRQTRERYGEYGYLLQRKLEPHETMRALSGGAIGSVRVVTLSDGGATAPLYAVWKIPSVSSIADNFWRAGNIVAHVDIDDGEVLCCRIGSGTAGRAVDRHPDTGATLVGLALPCWNEVCRLAVEAAALFYSVGVIGWDIAITDTGPCIIEGNVNPDHGLLQAASGRGLYASGAGRRLLEARAAALALDRKRERRRRHERRAAKRERRERLLSEGLSRDPRGKGSR